MLLLTIGTLFCLWMGEKITDKGIGQGISLIIITGIIARFTESIVMEVRNSLEVGNVGFILLFLESIIWLIIIFFTLCIIQIVRKVPLQYVRYRHRSTNNDISGYIPLKVTASGVMPIILAEAFMLLPKSLFPYLSNEKFKIDNVYGFWYNCIFIVLMIIFTFFYKSIALPINQIVYDLKRNEAYIPRVKPGKETIDLLSEINSIITFPGAILLAIIATFPTLIVKIGINRSLSLFYGGTSLLIIVGVVLDTLQHLHIYLHPYVNNRFHFIYQ